jgi:hypothetical protein
MSAVPLVLPWLQELAAAPDTWISRHAVEIQAFAALAVVALTFLLWQATKRYVDATKEYAQTTREQLDELKAQRKELIEARLEALHHYIHGTRALLNTGWKVALAFNNVGPGSALDVRLSAMSPSTIQWPERPDIGGVIPPGADFPNTGRPQLEFTIPYDAVRDAVVMGSAFPTLITGTV